MFTGIVEELGRVVALEAKPAGARLTVACSAILADAAVGASIAINGACLTAVELGPDRFSSDVAPETLKRTNLGDLRPGSPVNLERPLRATGRLDGHFVLGHVDGTAEVVSLDPLGDENWWLRIRIPAALAHYVVSKGSVAVDGISLTVAEIEGDLVAFTVIPHTWAHTTLHVYEPGARVNIEVDILAKQMEKLMEGVFFPSPEGTLPVDLKRELFEKLSAEIARQIRKTGGTEEEILSDFELWRKTRLETRRRR